MKLSWLKLDIGIFDDQKIKVIRNMPAGSELFVLWIGLLCLGMAGKTPGIVELDEGIPYSPDDLSNHFDLPIKTVQMALSVFVRLKMIIVSTGGTIEIINFRKHQSLERIEQQRERNRINVQKHRERKALLQIGNAHVTDYTITGNHVDLDLRSKNEKKNKKEEGYAEDGEATPPPPEKPPRKYTLPKHLEILREEYWAANGGTKIKIDKGHAVALGPIWKELGEENYTMAAKVWARDKTPDGTPAHPGYFVRGANEYYQKAKVKTKPMDSGAIGRLDQQFQSVRDGYKSAKGRGDKADMKKCMDWMVLHPDLMKKYGVVE